jgi:hypothetical protein
MLHEGIRCAAADESCSEAEVCHSHPTQQNRPLPQGYVGAVLDIFSMVLPIPKCPKSMIGRSFKSIVGGRGARSGRTHWQASLKRVSGICLQTTPAQIDRHPTRCPPTAPFHLSDQGSPLLWGGGRKRWSSTLRLRCLRLSLPENEQRTCGCSERPSSNLHRA